MRKHDIKTKSELKTFMTEEWVNIEREITKKKSKIYSQTFKKAVVEAKRLPTDY